MQAGVATGQGDERGGDAARSSPLNSASWTQAQCDLWERLKQFTISDETWTFPFSARLAREQGWSRKFASRAIEEYKKFLFLGIHAGHSVTPSEEVDAVWHLHMIYTRSYWNELCENVLRRDFHHGPTKGGASESAKHHDWYERTLDSYRRFFGEPPTDVWPEAHARFATNGRWVDLNSVYVMSRAKVNRALKAAMIVAGVGAIGASLIKIASAYASHAEPGNATMSGALAQVGFAPSLAATSNSNVLIGVVVMIAAVAIGLLIIAYKRSGSTALSGDSHSTKHQGGSGCSAGGCAYLHGAHGHSNGHSHGASGSQNADGTSGSGSNGDGGSSDGGGRGSDGGGNDGGGGGGDGGGSGCGGGGCGGS